MALSCDCQAYVDVFTFNRWKAQGLAVQKGQKCTRTPLIKNVPVDDEDTGKTEFRQVMTTSALFCRHQVAPIETKGKVAA